MDDIDPGNYEFSLYCKRCMNRVPEDEVIVHGCGVNLIRKLYHKRDQRYSPVVLDLGKCEIAKGYPEVILSENHQRQMLTHIDKFRYSDYKNVSIKGVNLAIKYLEEIGDSGWGPFYKVRYYGHLFIILSILIPLK